ncbi:hypothetical protein Naga_101500g1 [Nannochloropsis gaditana]|uniref:Uncharacterized protein n=1 Tax=Nannochloropsis gaditana TaxID=72520 RepID=W7T1E9_9STRA|nr:hypothetical protein Naga_101500g1 [Nannochloropsis gaditana]
MLVECTEAFACNTSRLDLGGKEKGREGGREGEREKGRAGGKNAIHEMENQVSDLGEKGTEETAAQREAWKRFLG